MTTPDPAAIARDSYIPLPWERPLPLSPQFWPEPIKPVRTELERQSDGQG